MGWRQPTTYFLNEALVDCPLFAGVFASFEWAARLGPAPVAFLISPDFDVGVFAFLGMFNLLVRNG